MKELIDIIRTHLLSPDYENAFRIWLEKLSNNLDFIEESVLLEGNETLELMLNSMGKGIFKTEKPEVQLLRLQEYSPGGMLHGFGTVQKNLVIILFFPDLGMGVAAVHLNSKQVIYSRLTKLDEPITGGAFMLNPDTTLN